MRQAVLAAVLWLVHALAGPLVFVALAYWCWTAAGRILGLVQRIRR